MKNFTVRVTFKAHSRMRNEKEFPTMKEAMDFAKIAKQTAHFVEVHEEVEPCGTTRCFRLITRFRDGDEMR